MIVVADASPINYLVLLELTCLLPALYDRVILPTTVLGELQAPRAPEIVRAWVAALPPWVEAATTYGLPAIPVRQLDAGEDAAIRLALHLHADLILMDERKGVGVAQALGITVTGTLGILRVAHRRGLIDGREATLRLLKETSFRHSPSVIQDFLSSL